MSQPNTNTASNASLPMARGDMADIGLAHKQIYDVLGILPGHADYEDALQCARIALARSRQLYNPARRAAFSTYATTAIKYALYGFYRQWRRHGFTNIPNEMVPLKPSSIDDPQSSTDDRHRAEIGVIVDHRRDDREHIDTHELAWAAIRDLLQHNQYWARVIQQRYIGGMTIQQIADRHGCCYETIRKAEQRALAYLRDRLGAVA